MSTTQGQRPKPATSLPTPNLRRGPKQFFRDVQREIKHISWPSMRETTRLTGIVLGVCTFCVTILFLLSILFTMFFGAIGVGG